MFKCHRVWQIPTSVQIKNSARTNTLVLKTYRTPSTVPQAMTSVVEASTKKKKKHL